MDNGDLENQRLLRFGSVTLGLLDSSLTLSLASSLSKSASGATAARVEPSVKHGSTSARSIDQRVRVKRETRRVRKRDIPPALPDYAAGSAAMPKGRRRAIQRRLALACKCPSEGSISGLEKLTGLLKRTSAIPPLGCLSLRELAEEKGDGAFLHEDSEASREGDGELAAETVVKNVLILMSDTGGGHRASAEALKQAFAIEYGDQYKVSVVDMWKEHTPWPFNQMPGSYSFLVKHEWMWKLAFDISKPRFVHQPQMAATSAFVAREVAKAFSKYRPDVIVSVHPLMQHVPLRVLRSRKLLHIIPFTTVITDLTTCHPTWFHKLVTTCFAPTPEVGARALKAGLRSSQVRVHGLPIRPDFCRPLPPKEELREQLKLDLGLPVVLLVGGGEGMGPVEETARALAAELGAGANGAPAKGQVVVICGRNRQLHDTLMSIKWPMPTQVHGFVNNMSEWMAASDCIITKAGPGTIAESLIRGIPIILNDYIAGQETGNIPFVVDNGVGKYTENPRAIASIVAGWFGPKADELKAMAEKALQLARPDAVFQIVRDMDRLARSLKPLQYQTNMLYA